MWCLSPSKQNTPVENHIHLACQQQTARFTDKAQGRQMTADKARAQGILAYAIL